MNEPLPLPTAPARVAVELPREMLAEIEDALGSSPLALKAIRAFALGKGLEGNYRLLFTGARMEPVDSA